MKQQKLVKGLIYSYKSTGNNIEVRRLIVKEFFRTYLDSMKVELKMAAALEDPTGNSLRRMARLFSLGAYIPNLILANTSIANLQFIYGYYGHVFGDYLDHFVLSYLCALYRIIIKNPNNKKEFVKHYFWLKAFPCPYLEKTLSTQHFNLLKSATNRNMKPSEYVEFLDRDFTIKEVPKAISTVPDTINEDAGDLEQILTIGHWFVRGKLINICAHVDKYIHASSSEFLPPSKAAQNILCAIINLLRSKINWEIVVRIINALYGAAAPLRPPAASHPRFARCSL